MIEPRWDALRVLVSAGALASIGGLAALLRSKKELSGRSVAAAVLYSGLLGFIIAAMGWNYLGADASPFFLLGVSALAGIGGVTVLDFGLAWFRNGGLNITVKMNDEGSDDS